MHNEEYGLFIDSSNINNIVATFQSNTDLSLHTKSDYSNGFVISNYTNTLTLGIMNNNITEPALMMINSNIEVYKHIVPLEGTGNKDTKPTFIYTSNIYIENINLHDKFLDIQQKIQQIINNSVDLPPFIAPQPSEHLNIVLVDVEKRYNLNDFFSGEVKSYNIISNPESNIDLNIHILTFTPLSINHYYIVTVQASNTWGANTLNFNVTEYAEVPPSLKNYSSLDIQLSNQVFVFNYNDYFFGLMQEFYIVSNPISSYNTIKLIDTSIYTISTHLYEYSNYDIVFGVNNVYGSTLFTLHVTDYKQDIPQFKNASNHFVELSNQYVTYIIEDIFEGLIQNIYLTYNPVGNIRLYDCNFSNIAVLWNDVYSYSNYTIGIGVSNVFGSNEYLIYVTDFLNEAPFVMNSVPNQFILSNVTIALNLEYYFRGFIQYYSYW